MPILLYRCTTWTLTKHIEKKLDGNCTRMLRAILSKSWRQHVTKQQLYGYLPPISKTIQIKWTRHIEHCWRSKDELISDVLLWTYSHERASLQQDWTDTGCCLENLPEAIDDWDEWRKILFTNPSARAGYDTRSNFKRSLTGFNSEFSFFLD